MMSYCMGDCFFGRDLRTGAVSPGDYRKSVLITVEDRWYSANPQADIPLGLRTDPAV